MATSTEPVAISKWSTCLVHMVQCLAERGFAEPEELIKKKTFVSDGGSDFVDALKLAEFYRIYIVLLAF